MTHEEFNDKVKRITDDITAMLIVKNRAYGNSALDPVRIFSMASPIAQLEVRIDDKLSRIARSPERGKDHMGEDVVRDLIGYLILLLIAQGR